MSFHQLYVQITAGCATLEPWAAIVVGFFAGALYLGASDLLIKFKIDDAVDAVPVHMVGGVWGLLSVGLLSAPELTLHAYGTDEHPGIFYSWGSGNSDARLLACQVFGLLFIFGWTFGRYSLVSGVMARRSVCLFFANI